MDKENGLADEHLPTLWMDEKIIKSKYSVNAIGGECQLHIFDFGGHDYYHDIHHIFYKDKNQLNISPVKLMYKCSLLEEKILIL